LAPEEIVSQQRLEGPEGLAFELVQSKATALVRVTGLEGELEGIVFACRLDGDLSDRFYETPIDGRPWRLLVRRQGQWTTYVPGAPGVKLRAVPGEVDAEALLDAHRRQVKEGRLAAIARFDEEGARAEANQQLSDTLSDVREACGIELPTEVEWATLGREQMMKYSIPGHCDVVEGALERACRTPEIRAAMGRTIERYRCRFGPQSDLSLQEGTLTYTVQFDASNRAAWVREQMDGWIIEAPDRTLRQARLEAAAEVCAMPKGGGVVVLGPSESDRYGGVSFGYQGRLLRQPERRFLPEGWFFEPRFSNPRNNDGFRGYDLRVYSRVEADDAGCRLTCGEEEQELRRLSAEEKRAFLADAEFAPLPDPREPYALARDRRGRYYYVDRGASAAGQRDFRLFVGRLGNLRRQRMKDIVADSEGEIFESQNGKLRLLLSTQEAEWITQRRRIKLVRVPVAENLGLIYGRLGVYLGQALHTPCDDFY
jgi:hypothetical protein